jgi:hypothetical protein
MSLKDILPGKKEEKHEYYWALVIEPGWVQAGIWRIENGKAQVIFSGPPSAWELDEELVDKVDTALSSAIQAYPKDSKEPEKCVFGLVSSWASDGQIKDEYLAKLKKICSDLSLVPVGFVILPEAIAHNIKSQEGSPLNACVLGTYGQSLEITLFKLGNIVGTTTVARSVSIIDDLAEGLVRLKLTDILPSRFILYDGKEGELEEARQSLLKVNWDDFEKFKFLHTPKIEIVSPDKKIEAVSLAGASELGDAAASKKETAKVLESRATHTEDLSEKVKKLEKKDTDEVQEQATSPESLGFVLEKDIAKHGSKEGESVQDLPQPKVDESVSDVVPVKTARRKFNIPTQIPPSMKEKLSPILGVIDTVKSFGSSGKKTFVVGLSFLILMLVLGFVFWWFYPKATVTVYVAPRNLEEKVNLVVDTDIEASDFSEKILKGETLETSVSGEKTKTTSGTKVVGEKAKGEATIYRVGSELTLSAGTELHGPSDLKFSLDEQVVVASGSAGSPGSTKVKVTANDVGSAYNLASGTNFTVGNYSTSDLEAKNESSFSGGTSYEINAVSAQDQEDLRKDLEEELKDKAKEELMGKIPEEDFFIAASLTATDSSRVYSNKVGDEASSLKLTLKISASALTLDKSELYEFSRLALEDKVPEGFVLRDEQIELDFGPKKDAGELHEFEIKIDSNLLPEIDTEEIAERIRGKYPTIARDYLTKEVPGFVRAEVRLKPNLPGRLGTLPRVKKNIEVEVAAEK